MGNCTTFYRVDEPLLLMGVTAIEGAITYATRDRLLDGQHGIYPIDYAVFENVSARQLNFEALFPHISPLLAQRLLHPAWSIPVIDRGDPVLNDYPDVADFPADAPAELRKVNIPGWQFLTVTETDAFIRAGRRIVAEHHGDEGSVVWWWVHVWEYLFAAYDQHQPMMLLLEHQI